MNSRKPTPTTSAWRFLPFISTAFMWKTSLAQNEDVIAQCRSETGALTAMRVLETPLNYTALTTNHIRTNQSCFTHGLAPVQTFCSNNFGNLDAIEGLRDQCLAAGGQLVEQSWFYECRQLQPTNIQVLVVHYKFLLGCVGAHCVPDDMAHLDRHAAALPDRFEGTNNAVTCSYSLTSAESLEGAASAAPSTSFQPSVIPTGPPSQEPSNVPSNLPSQLPTTSVWPSVTPTNSAKPSVAPSDMPSQEPSTCLERSPSGGSIVGASIGMGFLYFVIVYGISVCRGLCRDAPNIFIILLQAAGASVTVLFTARPPTSEEICEGTNSGTLVVDQTAGAMTVLIFLVEMVFDVICCDGLILGEVYRYPQTRLLGPHRTGGERTLRWKVIVWGALVMGCLSAGAIFLDAFQYDWWVIVLFGIWEAFALFICFALGRPVSDNTDVSPTHVWAVAKWLTLDLPGAVASLTGLNGSIGSFVAQAVVELILWCLEKGQEEEEDGSV